MVTVSTAAATAAAAAAAELPLKGLLALNSRHLAPSTVIILDMGILGFFLAIRGLQGRGEGEPRVNSSAVLCVCSCPPLLVLQPKRRGSSASQQEFHGETAETRASLSKHMQGGHT